MTLKILNYFNFKYQSHKINTNKFQQDWDDLGCLHYDEVSLKYEITIQFQIKNIHG